MSRVPDPDLVASCPLGVELERDDCRTLAGAMTVRELADAEVLIEEGHVDDALHVIVSGALAVTRNTAGGTWVTLQLLRQGDIAGELCF